MVTKHSCSCVDSWSLRFRENQKTIKAQHYDGVTERLQRLCNQGGLTMGYRIILPSSHPGSPRSQQKHYQDAIAIMQRFGRPHLFITVGFEFVYRLLTCPSSLLIRDGEKSKRRVRTMWTKIRLSPK